MSVIVTWHPTYALIRNQYERGSFQVDLDRFARSIKNQLKQGPTKLITNPTPKDIEDLIAEGLPIACDIETRPEKKTRPWTGKDPTRAKLKTIGLGNKNWGLSIAWSDRSWPIIEALRRVFAGTIIGCNFFWFDKRILERYGFRFNRIEDIRDIRRALSSTSKLSLAYITSLYCDAPPWKEGEDDDEKGLVFTDDLEKLKLYNCQDCVYTARDYEGLINEPEWKEPRVQRLYEVHKETSQLAAELHTNGFKVDLYERKRLAKELAEIHEEKKQAFLQYVNLSNMRCTANDLRKLLYKRHETSSIRRYSLDDPIGKNRFTNTGLIKVDLNSLLLEVSDPSRTTDEIRKVIDLYWQANAVQKLRSTYVVTKKVSRAIGRDHRLRAGWNSAGADTGRWSCKDPNIQNLSAKDRNDQIRGKLPDVRRLYVSTPGKSLVHYDKAQLELRVRAAVVGDQVLEQDLASNDLYLTNAKDWFGLNEYEVPYMKGLIKQLKENTGSLTPELFKLAKKFAATRFNCKTGHLASQYGAGLIKVHQNMLKEDRNASWTTTQYIYNGFRRRYYQTVDFWEKEFARVESCGYSETLILHRRRIYAAAPTPSDCANYPVQGTAADIITLQLIEFRAKIARIGGDVKILTHEHDAVTFECLDKHVGLLNELINEVTSTKYRINGRDWTFPIELSKAKVWADC